MQKIDPDNLDIRVDTKGGRLYFTVKDNKDAELLYDIHENGDETVIEFTRTFVPEPLRNTGLGTKLVERGIELAKSNNFKIEPTCEFVAHYLKRHPELEGMRSEA